MVIFTRYGKVRILYVSSISFPNEPSISWTFLGQVQEYFDLNYRHRKQQNDMVMRLP